MDHTAFNARPRSMRPTPDARWDPRPPGRPPPSRPDEDDVLDAIARLEAELAKAVELCQHVLQPGPEVPRPVDVAAVMVRAPLWLPGRPVRVEAPPLPVRGDSARLERVLRILAAHAATQAPPGAAIRLRGEVRAGRVAIELGPVGDLAQIPETDLDICRAIITAHGGSIRVARPDCVCIDLPLRRSP